jgi:glycosyltransferase involved in cell wall biosynthesis
MNLLYSITAYPPAIGGAQIHTHLLVQQLHKNHQVQVVSSWDTNRSDWLLGTTLKAPGICNDYAIDGIPVHRIGLTAREKLAIAPFVQVYYPCMVRAITMISPYLEQHLTPYGAQADLLHNIRVGREILSYASFNTARRYDIPFVMTPLHHPRWVGWRYQAYIQLYRMADIILALTNAEKQTLVALGVSEDRIFITGIGPVLAENARPEQLLQEHSISGPFVLFLGQHYHYKGYRQILQAAPLIWRRVPEMNFVFIGPEAGHSEKYFKSIKDPRIHRLGKVSLQKKTDALAACSLLCVPSTQESFGGVYTEAWSLGKPVIGCNIPAVSEVITDGIDGYLLDQDPAQIADRIIYLLLNPTKAKSMGEAGKRKVEEYFTWHQIAQRTEQAYTLACR